MKRLTTFCFSLFLLIQFCFGQEYIQVTASSVNIRFSPSTSSTVITQAKEGNIFELVGESGDWYKILMFAGEHRCIYKTMCEKVTYSIAIPGSEQTRKAVFMELVKTEDRAQAEADRRYPTDIYKNIDYSRLLNDRYKLAVMNKYHLQPPVYYKIIVEGVDKKWLY